MRLSNLPNRTIKLLKYYSGRGCCKCSETEWRKALLGHLLSHWRYKAFIRSLSLSLSLSLSYMQDWNYLAHNWLLGPSVEVWASIHLWLVDLDFCSRWQRWKRALLPLFIFIYLNFFLYPYFLLPLLSLIRMHLSSSLFNERGVIQKKKKKKNQNLNWAYQIRLSKSWSLRD